MPYVEGQTIHDADSHVMELPGTLNPYVDPKFRAPRSSSWPGPRRCCPEWSAKSEAKQDDPEFRAGAEANILLRKNYEALGAFRAADRPKALDHLGFASQLVFTTACLSNFGLEQMGEVELALRGGPRPQPDDDRVLLGRPPPAGHRLCAAGRPRARAADRPRGASSWAPRRW